MIQRNICYVIDHLSVPASTIEPKKVTGELTVEKKPMAWRVKEWSRESGRGRIEGTRSEALDSTRRLLLSTISALVRKFTSNSSVEVMGGA